MFLIYILLVVLVHTTAAKWHQVSISTTVTTEAHCVPYGPRLCMSFILLNTYLLSPIEIVSKGSCVFLLPRRSRKAIRHEREIDSWSKWRYILPSIPHSLSRQIESDINQTQTLWTLPKWSKNAFKINCGSAYHCQCVGKLRIRKVSRMKYYF
jgi:hypothetical protein